MRIVCAFLLVIALIHAPAQAQTPRADVAGVAVVEPIDPFEMSSIVPADVSLYVHVRGAADLRRQLAQRPIAEWFNAIFSTGDFHRAWLSLSGMAKLSDAQFFDLCLGESLTFVLRGQSEWALLTEVDSPRVGQLLRQLRVRVREPQHGMAIAELPEQEFMLARQGSTLLIGPTKQLKLFNEVAANMNNAAAGGLNREPAFEKYRQLGLGRVGVFMRHDPPMGGWSIAVADLHGDELTIHHAANFESAPFNHGVTKLTCDRSPMAGFSNDALLAIIQPTDTGDGPVEAFLAASVGEGLISKDMRKNLGDRRLIIVGEEEGRQMRHPVDLLSTTFVNCLELKDRTEAINQLDQQMIKLSQQIQQRCQGSMLEQVPEAGAIERAATPRGQWKHGQPREVDLSQAANWFTGGFPIMKNLSLNWTVADGPHGSWFVIASHRRSMEHAVKTLSAESPRDDRLVGKFDSCGVGNGRRIERHLQSWCDQAAQFAEPENVDEFRDTLKLFSHLAGGIQKCQWQLARPTANEMRFDVQIELAEPESSDSD